ncbi:hypothetical protein ES702_00732 [subsurface metagenome]
MKYTHKQIQDMLKLAEHHFHKLDNRNKIILKTIEELSSLNKLSIKLILNEINPYDIELFDELFDADFMMFQLKRLLIPDKYTETLFNNVVNNKLERELKRWGLDEYQEKNK